MSPISQSVTAGQSASYQVLFNSVGGFTGTVIPAALNWSNIPGATASWSPTQVTVSPNSTASAIFTIKTSNSTPAGNYSNMVLQGANGSATRVASTIVSLNVAPPANVPFISVTPTSGPQLTTSFVKNGSGFTPFGKIRQFYTFPGQSTPQEISPITADSQGKFSYTYTTKCSDNSGTYSYYVLDAGKNLTSNTISKRN